MATIIKRKSKYSVVYYVVDENGVKRQKWESFDTNAAARKRNAAESGKPPELILEGDISSTTWWGDEVTPRQFTEELNALGDVPEIVVRINSGGGDVFAANAIYTRLKDNAAKITVKIDGWAASAATIVAMAGDVIEIPGNGVFMVHDPKMGAMGYFSAEDFTKAAEELKVIKQAIINGYALKTGTVSDWIYQRIPAVLKLLFSQKDIESLIESALEEAKKAWWTNENLAAYIEPEYVVRLTPQEADEIAAKLNAEPGTILPGT